MAVLLFAGILGFPVPGRTQSVATEDSRADYDARFFQVLQSVFDTVRDADLQGVFQAATPIGCSDLLGDWRTAAFFNEDRNLERWFYKTFEEVQADLSRYIFQGRCGSETSGVQVVSRFPVRESMEAYNKGQLEFDRIAFKTNAPVEARFDSKTRVYAFELPYLYVTGRNGARNTYSMMPPDVSAKVAEEVTNRWECKAVRNAEITYRFLLCRTTILPRDRAIRSRLEEGTRGASAYVLLTDGREARATFTLSFPTDAKSTGKSVASLSRIADLGREDFRLRFANQSWESRIASTTILAGGQFVAVESVPTIKSDYCEWRPQSPATAPMVDESEKSIQYYLTRTDRAGTSPASFTFDARASANFRLGFLRCVFPGSDSATSIDMKRLLSVFGDHIRIEFR
jgi:hypothetical protein